MYKITVQALGGSEYDIYYPGDKEYILQSAVLTPDVGLAGEFTFVIPFEHPSYDQIVQNSIITIYKNNVEFWRGDIRNINTRFDKSLEVYCLEDLAWLGDEAVPMTEVTTQTNAQRFNAVISGYNANQVTKRQFLAGYLTAVNPSGSCTWQPEYGESALSGLRKFIAGANGYLKVRRVPSSGANGITLTFDSQTATESGFDFIDLYYEQNGTYYKRALSGTIGALSVYIPSMNFWLHWHTDGSVNAWGWKIASIVPQASGTVTGFNVATLPSATWSTVTDTSNLPESNHSYGNSENAYYKFEIPSTNVLRYIDIVTLADYGKQSSQTIEFGRNLLDYTKHFDATGIVNALYPYGAETEDNLYADIMERIVGNPIQNDSSISAYGRRARSVVFDTDSVATLNALAASYLSRYSQPHIELEITAVDLGSIVPLIDEFLIGDSVRVIAPIYAIDQWLYITHMDVDLLNPANNRIRLTDILRNVSLTSQVNSQASEIKELPSPYSVLEAAKNNALRILEGTDGGLITFVLNNDDQIIEQVIANNLDINQATKAWRWMLGGLAYLHRTYPSDSWQVGIAMTMDGQIVADFITTGSLTASVMQTNVISAINNQYLKIEAKNIDITGSVTFNDFTSSVQNTINGKADTSDLNNYPTKTSLQTGTTTINGGCITTGNIKSGNYSETSSSSTFSTSGTKFDLDTGLIKSKNFRIDNNGGRFGSLILDASDSLMYIEGFKELFYYDGAFTKSIRTYVYFCPLADGWTQSSKIEMFVNADVSSHEGYLVAKFNLQEYNSTTGKWSTTEYRRFDDRAREMDGKDDAFSSTFSATDSTIRRIQIIATRHSWSNDLYIWMYASTQMHMFEVGEKNIVGAFQGSLSGSANLSSLSVGSVSISTIDDLITLDDSASLLVDGSGDLYKTSGSSRISVTWSSSDRRIKDDITDLDTELSRKLIDATQTKRFRYKDAEGHHYGMIAQDARELLDDLGETDAMLEHSMNIPDNVSGIDDQRTIDYHEYIPHLINYVKDLQKQINELTEEIKILKEAR